MLIYELKVTLKDVGVPVWRKIQVDGRTSFYDLHQLLQICFGWEDCHLHQFEVRKTNGNKVSNIVIQSGDEESFSLFDMSHAYDEKEETIADWFKVTHDKIMYTYDFGDNWEHEIVLTKKGRPEKNGQYPSCVGAKNLAPEEDSRGEVVMGEVDLEYNNSSKLLDEINHNLMEQFTNIGTTAKEDKIDCWEKLLEKSKEYLQQRPWELLADNKIFAIIDPVTKEHLFCSVLGAAGEAYGLAVYIGQDGYRSLTHTFGISGDSDFNLLAHQRSIVLIFEDREDLEKEEYSLIKSYDVPFRGRKSWPSYRSYRPGYYPWLMEEEEARLLHLALEQTMLFYKEMIGGLEIPDILADQKVYGKVPYEVNNGVIFETEILDLKNYLEEDHSPVDLTVSSFELRRLGKLKKLVASIEFFVDYVNMPIQERMEERPVFPLLVLAVIIPVNSSYTKT